MAATEATRVARTMETTLNCILMEFVERAVVLSGIGLTTGSKADEASVVVNESLLDGERRKGKRRRRVGRQRVFMWDGRRKKGGSPRVVQKRRSHNATLDVRRAEQPPRSQLRKFCWLQGSGGIE